MVVFNKQAQPFHLHRFSKVILSIIADCDMLTNFFMSLLMIAY